MTAKAHQEADCTCFRCRRRRHLVEQLEPYGLTKHEARLLSFFNHYADEAGRLTVSMNCLSAGLGLSAPAIRNALDGLASLDVVVVEHTPGLVNTYHVAPDFKPRQEREQKEAERRWFAGFLEDLDLSRSARRWLKRRESAKDRHQRFRRLVYEACPSALVVEYERWQADALSYDRPEVAEPVLLTDVAAYLPEAVRSEFHDKLTPPTPPGTWKGYTGAGRAGKRRRRDRQLPRKRL